MPLLFFFRGGQTELHIFLIEILKRRPIRRDRNERHDLRFREFQNKFVIDVIGKQKSFLGILDHPKRCGNDRDRHLKCRRLLMRDEFARGMDIEK